MAGFQARHRYFGHDGDVLVILLAGETKKQHQREIEAEQGRWAASKRRKRSVRESWV